MINIMLRKGFVFVVIFMFIGLNVAVNSDIILQIKPNRIIDKYIVVTPDCSSITLTRYYGTKRPSVIFIHGMGCNHKIFDFDENHSLARFLNDRDWDVWLLDLRTHDGDGDFFLGKLRGVDSDIEFINKFWDFDRTLLKNDVVTAVNFVLNETNSDKIVLGGHSYGGYLAYAYAEIFGEDNLGGIITTAASAFALPDSKDNEELYRHGFMIGKRAFVRPFCWTFKRFFKYIPSNFDNYTPNRFLFYNYTTPREIQIACYFMIDDEPTGVWVDMYFGKDPRFYDGHWVDPQTLYDYSENLYRITVPFLAIAGDEDPQDPSIDIYRCYENVSSTFKEFYSFSKHSHMDLLFGDDCRELIFPKIDNFMKELAES